MNSTIYIGEVIRNSDIVTATNGKASPPQGKVLVRIQGISHTNKHNEDYKFPLGQNKAGHMSDENVILLEGHETEAYVAMPVVGGDSPGRYFDKPPGGGSGGVATFSESHDVSIVGNKGNATQGNSIAHMFAKGKPDGFTAKTDVVGTAGVNPYGKFFQNNYKDGQSRGSFALPDVGAKVLISFLNGSRNLPVVIGVLHGGPAIAGINSTAGAPDTYPNYPGHANVRRPRTNG